MKTPFTAALSCVIILGAPESATARDYHGPVNALVAYCQAQSSGFSVGQCLSLEIEQSTNELAAVCTYLKQQDLLGDDDLPATVAECIDYLQALEE